MTHAEVDAAVQVAARVNGAGLNCIVNDSRQPWALHARDLRRKEHLRGQKALVGDIKGVRCTPAHLQARVALDVPRGVCLKASKLCRNVPRCVAVLLLDRPAQRVAV